MATYKPQVKQANGTMADLNLDAATLNGKAESALSVSYATSAGSANSIGEERLFWGPSDVSKINSVSPIGMSLSQDHSANRIAFINPNAITVEQSDDDGATWTEIWNTENQKLYKVNLCTISQSLKLGTQANCTIKSRARITITGLRDANNTYLYTNPKKLLINVSNAGTMFLKIETRTGASMLNDGSWSAYNSGNYYSLSGWSGWNDIPLILSSLGGNYSQTSNIWQVRLTFFVTSINQQYPSIESVNAIRLYGENGWTINNNFAKTGHLYSFDAGQNATFPAKITSKSIQTTGDVTLYAASGNSPSLIFKRGTDVDDLTDYFITDRNGNLYFENSMNGGPTRSKFRIGDHKTPSWFDVTPTVGSNETPVSLTGHKHTISDITNFPTVISQVKVGETAYNPVNGVVSLPAYPTPGGGGNIYRHTVSIRCNMSNNWDLISFSITCPKSTAFQDVYELIPYICGTAAGDPDAYYKKQAYSCVIRDEMTYAEDNPGTAWVYYDPDMTDPMGNPGVYMFDYDYVNPIGEHVSERWHTVDDFSLENTGYIPIRMEN